MSDTARAILQILFPIPASLVDSVPQIHSHKGGHYSLAGGRCMKRTTGRGPKDKGRAFENEIRTALLKALPSLSPNDITPRSMGDPGVDLIMSQAARDLIPLAIELKRTERLNLKEALAQAEANAEKEHLPPCLIFRRNHSPAYAVLRLDDLLEMLADRAWNKGKKVVE